MRRFILSAVLVGAALVLQLTTINGLRLPAGGVPDLVLVVVAALGLAGGPLAGAVTGFAAGLCLDLAPPGTGIAGIYALVFCLVGWACGKGRPTLARSAVLPIVIAALATVLGELLVAGLGLALQPAQVSWTTVRQLLPPALFYDIAISPFVLYLVLLASSWLDDAPAGVASTAGQARLRRARAQGGSLAGSAPSGRAGLAGPAGSAGGAVLLGLGGWLAGPPQGRRARKAAARHTPRLSPGSGRARDGWIGGSAAARRELGGRAAGQVLRGQALRGQAFGGQPFGGQSLGRQSPGGQVAGGLGRGSRPHGSGAARLRSGVAGSAAGGMAPRTLAARPVHLRLAGGRKRDGAVGNMLGAGRPVVTGGARRRRPFSSLGRRRRGGSFRPSVMPGGSAAFGGSAMLGGPALGGGSGPRGSALRGGRSALRGTAMSGGATMSGSALRGSGMTGGSALSGQRRRVPLAASPSIRLGPVRLGSGRPGSARLGSARRRDGVVGGGAITQGGRAGHAASAPRFRIQPGQAGRPAGGGPSVVSGGGQTMHSIRGQPPARRLRMRPRRRDGMLGSGPAGGRLASSSRPATPRFRARPLSSGRAMSGKRPRFGYRRWSIVSVLTRRHGSLSRVWRPRRARTGGKA